ncbi:hypothetical protein [Marivirga harenae]|uniref:hypothetical protein n=1 Tax=Marivirga harenae TaxID=2010992 RepID=UPI0026DF5611|nr:hypothetical protein [Marivirga harenae]WKV10470.1 hypothetical protein Q3Y49_09615 [Marivirga harenae]
MRETFIPFFIKKYFDYILTLFISGILFWVVNFFGLGYTFDSRMYVEIANEVNSVGFFQIQGFNVKPPVLPFLIAVLGESNMVWLNFLCFIVIQAFGVYWSHQIKHAYLRYTFLTIVIFATPHLLISSFLWTEPLFLTILLLTFFLLEKHHKTQLTSYVFSAIVLLITLPFVRFAGIFLVVPTFGFLLIRSKRKKIVLLSIVILFFISFGWVFLFSEGFLGRWDRFITPLISGRINHIGYNLTSYSKAITSWFFPYMIDGFFSRSVSVLILFIVIYKSSLLYFQNHRSKIYLTPLLFIIYCVLMISVFRVEYYAAERYLAIFYLLLFLNLFLQIDDLIKSTQSIIVKRVTYFGIALLGSYSVLRAIRNVFFWNGLRTDSFDLSSILI